jgi:predicted ATPase
LTSFPNVGAKGEQTVNLLYKKKDDLVYEKLCLGQDAKTLATQTEEWLNQIFDGAKVEIPSSQSNIIELLLNTSTSKDRFKPANIGFGYHCILPIVVSGLIAKEGEMLIVENPEAHLHPRAQSRLAQFLAKVSSCGVQVFIETHSDHILNALRIAVLDKIITPDDLSILYFQRNAEQPVVQIPIQLNGGIEEWPEGFFDQMDKDFSRLFGI